MEDKFRLIRPGDGEATELSIPGSKSWANRILFRGAIEESSVFIENLPEASDVTAGVECLRRLGKVFTELSEGKISMSGSIFLKRGEVLDLMSGDGGTTNRFLVALLSKLSGTFRIFPRGGIVNRPFAPFSELFSLVPFKANPWLQFSAPIVLPKGKIEVDCSESTQFLSALLLAYPERSDDFIAIGLKSSKTYLKLTYEVIDLFKKNFGEKGSTFTVPLDQSSLGYPLAYGMHIGEVKVKNYQGPDPYQADSEIINILKRAGAKFELIGGELLALPSSEELSPLHCDAFCYPDLIPTLIFIASYIKGESIFRNLSVLRVKESDRLEEILKLLDIFAVKYVYEPTKDCLKIIGSAKNIEKEVSYYSPDDHRICMLAYLFLKKNAGGRLYNYECVKKSFPNFFELMPN